MTPDELFEAHVRFELTRWDDERLPETLRGDIDDVFAWLWSVRLRDIVDGEALVAELVRRVASAELPADLLRDALAEGRDALADDDVTFGELLPDAAVTALASALVRMHGAREILTTQLTENVVYARLLSHVLYRGIKAYLLTENVLARRIPGASSLMRLGQSALSNAAPNLEKGIDRQLIAFVNANMTELLRESKHFLDAVLDDATLVELVERTWREHRDRTLGEVSDELDNDVVDEAVTALEASWTVLRATPLVEYVIAAGVDSVLDRYGDELLGDVLGEVGGTPDAVHATLVDALRPAVASARESGRLEAHVRRRLGDFYATLEAPADGGEARVADGA